MRRLVLTDLDRGTVHEFRDTDVRLGRDARCDLVVEAPAAAEIGGVHARIAPRSTGWCLTDEQSRGGTFVNHVRLAGHDQAILRVGDVIRLGAGTAGRRFRVARAELSSGARVLPPTESRAAAAAATDVRIAAAAAGGAATVSVGAVLAAPAIAKAQAPTAANAAPPPTTGEAAPTGIAPDGTTAHPPRPDGATRAAARSSASLDPSRATQLFAAAGGGVARAVGSRGPGAASKGALLATAAGAAIAVATAGGLYVQARSHEAAAQQVASSGPAATGVAAAAATAREADAPVSVASAGGGAAAGTAAPSAESVRLATAAAKAGGVVVFVEAFDGGTARHVAGLVLDAAGRIVVPDEVAGADSVRVTMSSRGAPVAARLRDEIPGDGLRLLQASAPPPTWLTPDQRRGAVGSAPVWAAVVGFDRAAVGTAAMPPLVASAGSAVGAEAEGFSLRGTSSRMLPGSVVVDADGRILGITTRSGPVPLPDASATGVR